MDAADQVFVSDAGTSLKKADIAAIAKYIVENYAGSTIGGSAQSVQAAIGALNSRIPTNITDAGGTLTATGCTVDKAFIVRVGAVLYACIRLTTTQDIAKFSPILDGFPRALTNYIGAQNVRLYDHTSEQFFDAQITHPDGASKSYLALMEEIPSGHQIRGTFSYIVYS